MSAGRSMCSTHFLAILLYIKGCGFLRQGRKSILPESKLSALHVADKLAVLNFFQSELSPLADKLYRIFAL